MKKAIFYKRCAAALLGLSIVFSAAERAAAQSLGFLAGELKEKFEPEPSSVAWNDEEKEEIKFEDITLDIEEEATVTFINKTGEVVAVLRGDKSVLNEIYQSRFSKSYFLSAYGIHTVYLLR